MKILNMLSEDVVIDNLQSKTKSEVLRELAEHLVKTFNLKENPLDIVKILEAREELGSTGIGDGIAIPHGKISSIDDELLVVGRSNEGIDFNSMDGKPVHLFFLLVGPENSVGLHLKALARLSRLLNDEKVRDDLMKAKNRAAIYSLLVEADSKFN
ncbi:MAG: PTS sugar transporter subunit IIA [Candidatus Schekmanbacteria bacterium]|nr:MAG: PTS sugar transporter subunit IIA [Candidatus Schekmanbacteria bacterium]